GVGSAKALAQLGLREALGHTLSERDAMRRDRLRELVGGMSASAVAAREMRDASGNLSLAIGSRILPPRFAPGANPSQVAREIVNAYRRGSDEAQLAQAARAQSIARGGTPTINVKAP